MSDFGPDCDILEEKPKDWLPFMMAMMVAVSLAIIVCCEVVLYLKK